MRKMKPSSLLNAVFIARKNLYAIDDIIAKDKGQGRGNWGHKGRPGMRGGSAKGNESSTSIAVTANRASVKSIQSGISKKINSAILKVDTANIKQCLDRGIQTGDIITSGDKSFIKKSNGTYIREGKGNNMTAEEVAKEIVGVPSWRSFYSVIKAGSYMKKRDGFDYSTESPEQVQKKKQLLQQRYDEIKKQNNEAVSRLIKAKDYEIYMAEHPEGKLDQEEAKRIEEEVQKIQKEKPYTFMWNDQQKQIVRNLDVYKKYKKYEDLLKVASQNWQEDKKVIGEAIAIKAELADAEEKIKSRRDYYENFYTSKAREILQTKTPVKSNPPQRSQVKRTSDQIVQDIGGGDKTGGSCVSLAIAYAVCMSGYDVLDFRGGESREFFSHNFEQALTIEGVQKLSSKSKDKPETHDALNVLKQMETEKEYIFGTGKHAAVVRRNKQGTYEYLQLQSHHANGWRQLGTTDEQIKKKLIERFVAFDEVVYMKTQHFGGAVAVPVQQFGSHPQAAKIAGYINTASGSQLKGAQGHQK